MVDLNRKRPSSANAPTPGLCFLSEQVFLHLDYSVTSVFPQSMASIFQYKALNP